MLQRTRVGQIENPRSEPPTLVRPHDPPTVGARCDEVGTVSLVESESLDSGFSLVAVDLDERIRCVVDDPRHRSLQSNECALDGLVAPIGRPRWVDLIFPVGSEESRQ